MHCGILPFNFCLMSSAISLDQDDVLSAWYTAPVSLDLSTSAMISLVREALNLRAAEGARQVQQARALRRLAWRAGALGFRLAALGQP